MIYSDKNLAQKIERSEARSNVDFVEARGRMFPESGAQWTEVGGAYAMFDGVESPLTQTFGLGVFDEITDAELDRLEAFFRKHDAPVFHEVSPLAGWSMLELLNRRGYQPIELTSVLYQPLLFAEKENTPDLPLNPQIKTRVIEKGEEEIWARASADAWATEGEGLGEFMLNFGQINTATKGGFPFLAELDGAAIATGMLFIYDDVAILAGASTIPEGRRKGAQNALLDARLRFAASKGCTIAIMGAMPGSQSQRNAEKNGFRIAYTRTKWQLVK
ncbi:MAG TPA: GNAT family N-acetyltransferase [Pyrinomonadaceae bacterium]|nr:GNAT family N-acetyltransferase [Pyrinomonadaceae bacterium]